MKEQRLFMLCMGGLFSSEGVRPLRVATHEEIDITSDVVNKNII